jgi:molybdate transport system substrate-binding protein
MGPMINRRHMMGLAAAALIGLSVAIGTAQAQPKELVIFAAASLKNALDEAAAAWVKETGKPAPKISYAASNALAKQIEQGAPADLFLSADLDWMDYVAGKSLIKPETRVSLLANRIALIAPSDSTAKVTLASGVDLSAALGSGKLAMGNVDSVPGRQIRQGRAGEARRLGQGQGQDRPGRQCPRRFAAGCARRGAARHRLHHRRRRRAQGQGPRDLPGETHPPIIYPVAVLKDSANPDAQNLLTYLRGAGPKATFEKQGFTVLNKPANAS